MLKIISEEIGTRQARGATIHPKVKWKQVGDRCFAEFLTTVKRKNSTTIIFKLKDCHGRV